MQFQGLNALPERWQLFERKSSGGSCQNMNENSKICRLADKPIASPPAVPFRLLFSETARIQTVSALRLFASWIASHRWEDLTPSHVMPARGNGGTVPMNALWNLASVVDDRALRFCMSSTCHRQFLIPHSSTVPTRICVSCRRDAVPRRFVAAFRMGGFRSALAFHWGDFVRVTPREIR